MSFSDLCVHGTGHNIEARITLKFLGIPESSPPRHANGYWFNIPIIEARKYKLQELCFDNAIKPKNNDSEKNNSY